MSKTSKRLLNVCTLSAGIMVALSAQTGLARDHLYGIYTDESLNTCEAAHWRGESDLADNCYRALATTSGSALIRAEALWALGDLQNANSMFQQAADLDAENPLVKIRWGELYMETYQYQEAYNLFAEALELDQDNTWAHLAALRALQQGNDNDAIKVHMDALEGLLAPPAITLQLNIMEIHKLLQRDLYSDAAERLDDAFELAEDENLPVLELYALRAAHAFMTLQPYQQFIDAALTINPVYGDAWAIPGYFASIVRRYREAGEFYQQAVAIQPDHWNAHLQLGQNYLRLNRVSEAQQHVRLSYEGDAFNPVTVNVLRLLDTFIDDMETISFPDPPQGAFPELVLRLNKSETDVLQEYARELAMQSINTYKERYRFEPRQPIIVEIFPNHEDFVVRSIGMPGVGILGVTFGYLFAMDSPAAHPRGESYHWGTTLWHEMAHVFTVEATDHLVPRWFSEGISVFEEWQTGPIPGRKIPNNVLAAMAEDKFLPIAVLDDGFMRPTYDDQVIVSYMQAGLVFEFINEQYGFDKIVDILYLFNDGTSAVSAIEQTLDISDDAFDKQFKQFIQLEYGPLLGQMKLWQEDMQASFAALEQEHWQEAVAAADRAIFSYPDYVEPNSPYIAKARALARLDDEAGEFQALEIFWQKGGYASRALLALADRYLDKERNDEALAVLQDVIWADPFLAEVHIKLGDLYLAQNKAEAALREFEVLMALDPIDKASANLKIARAHQALGNYDQSMNYLMTALDIAPQYRPAQMLLLELSRAQGDITN